MMRPTPALFCIAIALVALSVLPQFARAASEESDWPCPQPLVPRISAPQVWAGPELNPESWQGDIEVSRLASQLAARRLAIEDADKLIEKFSKAQPKEIRNAKLTALFGRTLEIINSDRASIIAGIKRFSHHQDRLAKRIRDNQAKLSDKANPPTNSNDLTEMVTWDLRIFHDREKSMTYLCEQPTLLEQRAFALGRSIYSYVED